MEQRIRFRLPAFVSAPPLLLFGGVALLSLAVNLVPTPWQTWQPALCYPACFCEAARSGFVRQPANTYSNLAYILVGVFIAFPARTAAPAQRENPMQAQPAYARLYGWSVFAIGAGSLFYHASLTLSGQFFDWVGMYAFISFVFAYGVSRVLAGRLPGWLFGGLYALTLAALCADFFINPHRRVGLFQAFVLIGLGLEVVGLALHRRRVQVAYFVAALASFFLAHRLWLWDLNGTWCSPASLLQGHAAWHVLTAATTALLYRYYSSEAPRAS